MLYFAYGSNMDWAQIKARCPSAQFVGMAKFPDHQLAFSRESITRKCGVADAVHAKGRNVWGAVFAISELDVGALDKLEGYRPGRNENSYRRRNCMVFLDGDENRPITGQTYFADPQPNPLLPNRVYVDQILAGARYWHLPPEYIADLEGIEVSG